MRQGTKISRRMVLAVLAAVMGAVAAVRGATTTAYIGPDGGLWTNSGYWDNGLPNSNAFDVTINSVLPLTVQLNANETINNLSLNGPDTLSLLSTLTLSGPSLSNTGTLLFNATASSPTLSFNTNTTLSGGGTILMTSTASQITGTSGVRLTTDNFISGSGSLGLGLLKITNTGTITATAGTLTLAPVNATDGFINTGILRADGGNLVLKNGTYTNTGGVIEALDKSLVMINSNITGGTIRSVGGGTVTVTGGLSGTQSALALSGLIMVGIPYGYWTTLTGPLTNTGTLVLNGPTNLGYYSGSNVAPPALTLNNTGLIQVGQSTNSYVTNLIINADTTLSGGGSIVLNGNYFNYQGGSYVTRLTTDNVISGKGVLGTNDYSPGVYFTNKGTITATAVTGGLGGNSLTLCTGNYNSSNPQSSYNSGVLRADGGTLVLYGKSGFINTGGLIEAAANSVVNIGTLTISGGTVRSVGGGTVTVSGGLSGTQSALALSGLVMVGTPSGNSTTLSGTLTNAGTLVLNGPAYLGYYSGSSVAPQTLTLNNTGLIQVGQTTTPTLYIGADTTLSGGGSVSLYWNGFGSQGGRYAMRLTTDNVITGKGVLGTNAAGPDVYFTNTGTITAANVGGYGPNILTLCTGYYNPLNPQSIYNSGVLCADGGSLVLSGANILVNTGGLIEAAANNVVNLNGGTITGGTVRSVGGGTVTIAAAMLVNTTLSGNIWSLGVMSRFAGMLTNAGTLSFVGSKYPLYFGVTSGSTDLSNACLMQFGTAPTYLNCDTLWTDGGSVTLSGSVFISAGTVRLTTDNILSGSGTLGVGTFRLTNAGTITATAGILSVTTDTNAGVVNACLNAGVLRADGGSLILSGGTVSNANGVVEALHGSTVSLQTQVNSGILRAASGGILRLDSPNAIGPDATISFEGGILQFSGSNTTDYSDRFSSADNQAYNLDTNGQVVHFSHSLSSTSSSFSKLGTGILVLTAANALGATAIKDGTLEIGNGGKVTATGVSIDSPALLVMNVGDGSLLNVGTGSLDNSGMIRFKAVPGLAAGAYSPITAGTWTGTEAVQALGGKWDTSSHVFTVVAAATGVPGVGVEIDRSVKQRVAITDGTSGDSVWAGFMPTAGSSSVTFAASELTAGEEAALVGAVPTGWAVLEGWTFAADGYTSGEPVYLSMKVGSGWVARDLAVWHFDGAAWTAYAAGDLSYDGTYASFTVMGFSGYAVTVPEAGTVGVLGLGVVGMLCRRGRRHGKQPRMNTNGHE